VFARQNANLSASEEDSLRAYVMVHLLSPLDIN